MKKRAAPIKPMPISLDDALRATMQVDPKGMIRTKPTAKAKKRKTATGK